MSWTTPADLRAQVQKRWSQGVLLRNLVEPADLFPLRLVLKGPSSTDMSERFEAVREWVRDLQSQAKIDSKKSYRLTWRTIRHRVIGSNALPDEAWVDTPEDAFGLIGRGREVLRFADIVDETRTRMPSLLPWLARYPLRGLALADDWSGLLDIATWLHAHPRPGIYLRQVDLPGMHSKFIEGRRPVLSELLDIILPASAIDTSVTGTSNFLSRYGFRERPLRVRFRLLDPRQALFPGGTDQDITITQDAFARLYPAASRVFITENEVNFLAFPALADSMVVFGAGYGFDMLAQAKWLENKVMYYWGDIDTHGFAILDQLRSHMPHVMSFLMDNETLTAHRGQWGVEPSPTLRELTRLTPEERSVYDDIRWQRLQNDFCVRLEQERISFGWLQRALDKTKLS
ncbi:hypothetical protein CR159_13845 [Pollutimonas subterranea]|uniref:Wadjet protein JetD C-terminal domain-containing protein n=1 Tax=Pollutimonas subterranea TaxID=2045210 RepID=A0A2N4U301_9BURK|nr:DUF3322 domain-containing protein [Pollutimonas subterranea]PLC49377.1 hypothetical protein CR159_13845 [Pollutimonas subterranea]